MKLQPYIAGVLVVGWLAGAFLTGCATNHGQVRIDDPNLVVPHLEGVRYIKRSTGPRDELVFVVNTGKGWPGKKAAFGQGDRCSYSLTFTNGASSFPASEATIQSSARPSEPNFHPQGGRVTFTERDSGKVVVEVNLEDDRIPRLLNGTYSLTLSEAAYTF